MAVTETSEQGFFSRLSGAIGGIFTGIALIIIAIILLFWNEGRSVDRYATIGEARNSCVPAKADSIDAGHEGKLIHFNGPLKTADILTDSQFNVSVSDSLSLQRKVEMFQWAERTESHTEKKVGGGTKTTTTYTYEKVWSSSSIKSDGFKEQGHDNPGFIPYEDSEEVAKNVTLGARTIPSDSTKHLGSAVDVSLKEGEVKLVDTAVINMGREIYFNVYKLGEFNRMATSMEADNVATNMVGEAANSNAGANTAVVEANATATANAAVVNANAYRANPAAPEIGDVRISFTRYPVGDATVVAQQSKNSIKAFTTKTGNFYEVRHGIMSAEEVFKATEDENAMMTWFLRFLGFLMIYGGFRAIFKPITVLADIIPIFGDIAESGVGIISGLIAAVLSCGVIGIAWFFYRPFLAIALFILMGAALFGIVTLILKVRAAKKNAAPAPVPAQAEAGA